MKELLKEIRALKFKTTTDMEKNYSYAEMVACKRGFEMARDKIVNKIKREKKLPYPTLDAMNKLNSL